jgi:hypothetical protein
VLHFLYQPTKETEMAIETTASGTMITGADVNTYRLLTIRRGLKMQAETGMKLSRVSCLAAAKADGLTKARTARAAYADVDAFCVSVGIDSAGPLRN